MQFNCFTNIPLKAIHVYCKHNEIHLRGPQNGIIFSYLFTFQVIFILIKPRIKFCLSNLEVKHFEIFHGKKRNRKEKHIMLTLFPSREFCLGLGLGIPKIPTTDLYSEMFQLKSDLCLTRNNLVVMNCKII